MQIKSNVRLYNTVTNEITRVLYFITTPDPKKSIINIINQHRQDVEEYMEEVIELLPYTNEKRLKEFWTTTPDGSQVYYNSQLETLETEYVEIFL